jgi:hypothetical protein
VVDALAVLLALFGSAVADDTVLDTVWRPGLLAVAVPLVRLALAPAARLAR